MVEEVRSKGLHHAREVNRAHILSALDRDTPQATIMEVLGVDRTAIWRTRNAYLAGGVQAALFDAPRPGRPQRYGRQRRSTNHGAGVLGATGRGAALDRDGLGESGTRRAGHGRGSAAKRSAGF
ncbi:MAG: helix-turn-helix domain-containing protein [Burkholderiaceae bacterium]